MRMLNEFPEHRRADPRRRAEMQVYDQLAGSGGSPQCQPRRPAQPAEVLLGTVEGLKGTAS